IKLPGTKPPPRTLSNSEFFVETRAILGAESSDVSCSVQTFSAPSVAFETSQPRRLSYVIAFSSTKVFHSPHSVQRPSHFARSAPQTWHRKIDLVFAIVFRYHIQMGQHNKCWFNKSLR